MSRARRDARLNITRIAAGAHRELGIEQGAKGSVETMDAAYEAQKTIRAAAAVLKAALKREDNAAATKAADAVMAVDTRLLGKRDRELQAGLRGPTEALRRIAGVDLEAKVKQTKAERDLWQGRVDELNAAMVEHIVERGAVMDAGAVVFDGRVRGQVIEELV